ncbi:MAG: response regulator transcription factor [Pirellulales bacterium]
MQPELVVPDQPTTGSSAELPTLEKPSELTPEPEAIGAPCPAGTSNSRLAVISDHPLIRLAVLELARQNNFCLCCAEATTAEEAVRCVAESDPDVAFVDLSFSSGMGLHLIEELHSANPRTRLLASSPHDDLLYAGQVIGAGALGYLHRSAGPEEIQDAIQSVANGKTFVGRQFTKPFLGDGQSGTPFGRLTQREAQVFELIGQGDSTKRIARKLGLRTNTVETYRERIRGKLGAKDGADLVYRAIVWVLLNQ